ncbi:hypothetical protein JAAARDRAFT_47666 [Jaapia argillacea MUCL 33604]|uniref:Ketoreductase (KR) domain-containing protein n=1 Tax=Jaapia argillacea MUCL 33604 TaxID=933084 RepID=A0A067Q2X7_9AGAM|nr:hypothetical protein JAAARDRAFT_47666 [Jaapia argillacea MUCL 33604]
MKAGKVILACRNETKGKAAVADVANITGLQNAELWLIDLCQTSLILSFVEKFDREEGRLDILVMNAAMAVSGYEEYEGWEASRNLTPPVRLKVNYLSTALLSLLLLPSMIRTAAEHSAAPRLVVVASEMHFWARIPDQAIAASRILECINTRKNTPTERYRETKLLDILFVRALASHLPTSSPIIPASVNPGFCYSSLQRNITFPASIATYLFKKLFAWTSEEGSRQLLWAALGPPEARAEDEPKLRGGYVSENEVREVCDFILSDKGRECERRVWRETIEISSQASPKITAIVDQFLTRGE